MSNITRVLVKLGQGGPCASGVGVAKTHLSDPHWVRSHCDLVDASRVRLQTTSPHPLLFGRDDGWGKGGGRLRAAGSPRCYTYTHSHNRDGSQESFRDLSFGPTRQGGGQGGGAPALAAHGEFSATSNFCCERRSTTATHARWSGPPGGKLTTHAGLPARRRGEQHCTAPYRMPCQRPAQNDAQGLP